MIKGKTIVRAYTLNTMYADGKIELMDKKDNVFRIGVLELLKMIQKNTFEVEQKRKYKHLTLIENG